MSRPGWSSRLLGSFAASALLVSCTSPRTATVWAWNHRCQEVVVIPVVDQPGRLLGYRLGYGEGAVSFLWHPKGGAGCSNACDLPPEFRGILVKDETGRAVFVDRTALLRTSSVWEATIDTELLRKSPEVDAGAYLREAPSIRKGERDEFPEERHHTWLRCEGP